VSVPSLREMGDKKGSDSAEKTAGLKARATVIKEDRRVGSRWFSGRRSPKDSSGRIRGFPGELTYQMTGAAWGETTCRNQGVKRRVY